jgi:hypothetical protein
MSGRAQLPDDNSHPGAVILRSPPNWTAVAFFGSLGLLHLGIATSALLSSRWEAHMSLIFGTLFGAVGIVSIFVRHHVEIAPEQKRIFLRSGLGRFAYKRAVPFSNVLSVRVILAERHCDSCVCIVCADRDIEIPPSRTPRQQALALAMALNVRLIKVYAESIDPEPANRIARLHQNQNDEA